MIHDGIWWEYMIDSKDVGLVVRFRLVGLLSPEASDSKSAKDSSSDDMDPFLFFGLHYLFGPVPPPMIPIGRKKWQPTI